MKLSTEDRTKLTSDIVNALIAGQHVKYAMRNVAERSVEHVLVDFEHTPEASAPSWWARWKAKFFREVKPDVPTSV